MNCTYQKEYKLIINCINIIKQDKKIMQINLYINIPLIFYYLN